MKLVPWMFVFVFVASCARPALDTPAEAEPDPLNVTHWTDKTELFAEYPPLIVGRTSRFAIHLTRLDTFKALTEGRVEVRLSGGGSPVEHFPVEVPSRPGIFGVDVTPVHAGAREMAIVLQHPALDDEHRIGGVVVHADREAAQSVITPEVGAEETVRFLKEQQWALEFATSVVRVAPVRESVRVPAVIGPRPGGAADVVSPIDGRLVQVIDAPSGTSVTAGQEMARVHPPASAPAELPQLRQAQAEAATALQLATRDRERAERLVAAGAAPQRRLDDARAAEEQAQARATGAEARFAQYQTARSAGASASDDSLFAVRAPVSGVITERSATTGANVSEGTVLFRIVDARQVHVAGQVPERDLGRVRGAETAELEIPGQSARVPVGRLSSIGRVIDPRTRTVPMTFPLDNSQLGLAVGQAVFLHVLMNESVPSPVVPAAAIVDDGGRPIVFVQRGGESFERRAVTLGARAGNIVQVIDGVRSGERVVTTGAYLVRLASLSTQVPSQGHVH